MIDHYHKCTEDMRRRVGLHPDCKTNPLDWSTIPTPKEDSLINEYDILARSFEQECADSDRILAMFPDLHRSEGGRLPVAALLGAIRSLMIPTWYCGCGHTNGANLPTCAACGRDPNGDVRGKPIVA